MSNYNPYAIPQSAPAPLGQPVYRKIFSSPIDLINRSIAMVKGNYWMFLGITFVGVLLGSLVPLGIILGAMLIGIYQCYLRREAGQTFEFSDLFKGFDLFTNGLIATLLVMAASFVLMIPFMILMAIIGATMNGSDSAPFLMIIVLYGGIFLISILVYIPFIFAFQLIAEYKMSGLDAVKLSMKAAFANFGSVLVNLIALMFISGILAMMCYLPAIFFLPISMGWIFLLYRDVFPRNAAV